MPDGVLVLSARAVESVQGWFLIALSAAVISGFVLWALADVEDNIVLGVCAILCGLGTVAMFILAVCGIITRYDHTEYQVILDDSVRVNELLDRYEIVDQDGLIYTIKERSETDEK